jgi:hypothetical protein
VRQHHPFASEPFTVEADQYEIRVRGTMGDAVLRRFEEFEVEVEPVETVLRGTIRDQSELHGLLARIESLGLELVEIKQTEGRTRKPVPRSS